MNEKEQKYLTSKQQTDLYFDGEWPTLRKELEDAIRTTLVVENKKSIDLCVKKMTYFLDAYLIKEYSIGYDMGMYDAENK